MLATDAARPDSTRGALGRALALAPLVALSVLVLMLAHALPAQAATSHGAVVGNGTVQLGVNAAGDLNYNCVTTSDAVCPKPSAGNGVAAVGLRFQPLNLDSTSPGCLCEGWGAADAGSKLSGSANEDNGAPVHLAVDSFSAPSAAEAISTVTISDPAIAGKKMRVRQDYHPSPLSPSVYLDTVTITNTGTSAISDLRYRRVMDWDIEPTAFSEWVTIQGTTPQLRFDSDDGFASSDPLTGPSYIDSESVCGTGYTGPCQFKDLGESGTYPTVTTPDDHGGLFDFGFGALAVGASKTFTVFYGAAPGETEALAALTASGAQVYTLGESNCAGTTIATCTTGTGHAGVENGKPATFTFGFATTTSDVALTKSASPSPATVGENLAYTLTVRNNGPEQATGVSVSDPLPSGATFVSAGSSKGTCTGTATVLCNVGALASGEAATIKVVVRPTSSGSLRNTATASSASPDSNPANNSATVTTTVGTGGGGGEGVDLSGICPPGSIFSPAVHKCIIPAHGNVGLVTIGAPFQAPSGGSVLALPDARARYKSPCLHRRGGLDYVVLGTPKRNRITGTNGNDRILVFGANDKVDGGRGNDCIDGGAGKDRLAGGLGRDVLQGDSGRDHLLGGADGDRVTAGTGNDRVEGNSGPDVLRGGVGNDSVLGGSGNDRLYGQGGADLVSAGYGRDRLLGGTGGDTLVATILGPAARVIDGGPGNDTARFNPSEAGHVHRVEHRRVIR